EEAVSPAPQGPEDDGDGVVLLQAAVPTEEGTVPDSEAEASASEVGVQPGPDSATAPQSEAAGERPDD
ncbi:MAG: hypothetical protein ACXWNI_03945, partial [Candidatus Limnocylindrales bacterium]